MPKRLNSCATNGGIGGGANPNGIWAKAGVPCTRLSPRVATVACIRRIRAMVPGKSRIDFADLRALWRKLLAADVP
jgi:hypothetical protein